MDTGKLNMLHNCRDIDMLAICKGIGLALKGILEESVYKERPVRCDANCLLHILFEGSLVINNFHTTSAKYKGRSDHNRVTDAFCNLPCLFEVNSHTALRHWNLEVVHHLPEQVPVLGNIDGVDGCSKDVDAALLKLTCNVERCLTAELDDDSVRFLLLVDLENILGCDRLEVELVRCVVVGGYSLRVAVYDYGLVAHLLKLHCGMTAAVVELDSLSDSVRAAAQDHDLLLIV